MDKANNIRKGFTCNNYPCTPKQALYNTNAILSAFIKELRKDDDFLFV